MNNNNSLYWQDEPEIPVSIDPLEVLYAFVLELRGLGHSKGIIKFLLTKGEINSINSELEGVILPNIERMDSFRDKVNNYLEKRRKMDES